MNSSIKRDFQLGTSFDYLSQPNIKEYKHVKFYFLMMNYKKEGQGKNGEIAKDGQQQTLCTHRRALYSCQSKHMVRPRRQAWSQSPLLHQQYDKPFSNEVASATIYEQQEHICPL